MMEETVAVNQASQTKRNTANATLLLVETSTTQKQQPPQQQKSPVKRATLPTAKSPTKRTATPTHDNNDDDDGDVTAVEGGTSNDRAVPLDHDDENSWQSATSSIAGEAAMPTAAAPSTTATSLKSPKSQVADHKHPLAARPGEPAVTGALGALAKEGSEERAPANQASADQRNSTNEHSDGEGDGRPDATEMRNAEAAATTTTATKAKTIAINQAGKEISRRTDALNALATTVAAPGSEATPQQSPTRRTKPAATSEVAAEADEDGDGDAVAAAATPAEHTIIAAATAVIAAQQQNQANALALEWKLKLAGVTSLPLESPATATMNGNDDEEEDPDDYERDGADSAEEFQVTTTTPTPGSPPTLRTRSRCSSGASESGSPHFMECTTADAGKGLGEVEIETAGKASQASPNVMTHDRLGEEELRSDTEDVILMEETSAATPQESGAGKVIEHEESLSEEADLTLEQEEELLKSSDTEEEEDALTEKARKVHNHNAAAATDKEVFTISDDDDDDENDDHVADSAEKCGETLSPRLGERTAWEAANSNAAVNEEDDDDDDAVVVVAAISKEEAELRWGGNNHVDNEEGNVINLADDDDDYEGENSRPTVATINDDEDGHKVQLESRSRVESPNTAAENRLDARLDAVISRKREEDHHSSPLKGNGRRRHKSTPRSDEKEHRLLYKFEIEDSSSSSSSPSSVMSVAATETAAVEEDHIRRREEEAAGQDGDGAGDETTYKVPRDDDEDDDDFTNDTFASLPNDEEPEVVKQQAEADEEEKKDSAVTEHPKTSLLNDKDHHSVVDEKTVSAEQRSPMDSRSLSSSPPPLLLIDENASAVAEKPARSPTPPSTTTTTCDLEELQPVEAVKAVKPKMNGDHGKSPPPTELSLNDMAESSSPKRQQQLEHPHDEAADELNNHVAVINADNVDGSLSAGELAEVFEEPLVAKKFYETTIKEFNHEIPQNIIKMETKEEFDLPPLKSLEDNHNNEDNDDDEASRCSSLASAASCSTTTSSLNQLVIDHPMEELESPSIAAVTQQPAMEMSTAVDKLIVPPLKLNLKRKLSSPAHEVVKVEVDCMETFQNAKRALANELRTSPAAAPMVPFNNHLAVEAEEAQKMPVEVPPTMESAMPVINSLLWQHLQRPYTPSPPLPASVPLPAPPPATALAEAYSVLPPTMAAATSEAFPLVGSPLALPHDAAFPLLPPAHSRMAADAPISPPALAAATKFLCFKCKQGTFDTLNALNEHQLDCLASTKSLPVMLAEPAVLSLPLPPTFEAAESFQTPSPTPTAITRRNRVPRETAASSLVVPKSKRQYFKCYACSTYHDGWHFFLHVREQHNRYMCLYCVRFFTTAEKLALHLENKHDLEQMHYNTEAALRLTQPLREEENGGGGKAALTLTAAETRLLLCCTCQHLFGEEETFTEHVCSDYMKACGQCGLKGRHSSQCGGSATLSDAKRSPRVKKKAKPKGGAATPLGVHNSWPNNRTLPQATAMPTVSLPALGASGQHPASYTAVSNFCDNNSTFNQAPPVAMPIDPAGEDSDSSVGNNMVIDETAHVATGGSRGYSAQQQQHQEQEQHLAALTNPTVPPLRLIVPKLKLCVPKEFQKSVDAVISSSDSEEDDEDDDGYADAAANANVDAQMQLLYKSNVAAMQQRRNEMAAALNQEAAEPGTSTATTANLLISHDAANRSDENSRQTASTSQPADDDDSLDEPNSSMARILQEIERTKQDIQLAKQTKRHSHHRHAPAAVAAPETFVAASAQPEATAADLTEKDTGFEDPPATLMAHPEAANAGEGIPPATNKNWSPTPPASPHSRLSQTDDPLEHNKLTVAALQAAAEHVAAAAAATAAGGDPSEDSLTAAAMRPPLERRDTVGSDVMDIDDTITSDQAHIMAQSELSQLNETADGETTHLDKTATEADQHEGLVAIKSEPPADNLEEMEASRISAHEQHESSVTGDLSSTAMDTTTVAVVPEPPADGIEVAGDDIQIIDLQLDRALEKYELVDFVRICLKAVYSLCLYCNHARRIAVNGESLVLHLIAQHRFAATVDSITAEELQPETIVNKLKTFLPALLEEYFNASSYCTLGNGAFTEEFNERVFECFQCRFVAATHKELYLHNRKMHMRTAILCFMCRSNFFSFSEILCHICPGAANKTAVFDVKFRCCLCPLDQIPSPFRLMVHLRKAHSVCDVCLEDCRDQSRLSSHVWKHKLHHVCYRCGIAYGNKMDITKHLFWKHGTESIICKRCTQKRWRHVYHFCVPPATFTCDVCSLCFSRAVYLRVHKRIHCGDLRYACPEVNCEGKFISRPLLMKHLAQHQPPEAALLPAVSIEDDQDGEKNKDQKDEIEKVADDVDATDKLNGGENEEDNKKQATSKLEDQTAEGEMAKISSAADGSLKAEGASSPKHPTEDAGAKQSELKTDASETAQKESKTGESAVELEAIKKESTESGASDEKKDTACKLENAEKEMAAGRDEPPKGDEKPSAPTTTQRKKRKKKKRSKGLLADLNLIAPNLSESDSSDDSDGESKSKGDDDESLVPNVMLSPPSEAENDDLSFGKRTPSASLMPGCQAGEAMATTHEGDEDAGANPSTTNGNVLEIWKNLLQAQGNTTAGQTEDASEHVPKTADYTEDNYPQPSSLHVVFSDHDYCSMFRPPEPALPPPSTTATVKNKKRSGLSVSTTPHSSPMKARKSSSANMGKKSPRRTSGRRSSSSSNGDSSSSSDSSCSCGSNCSCSSSGSGGSSSGSGSGTGSGSDDSGDSSAGSNVSRNKRHRKKSERDRMRKKSHSVSPLKKHNAGAGGADSGLVNVENDDDDNELHELTAEKALHAAELSAQANLPTEPLFYESDLETAESETDEEFYDEHPQRLASELLAQKRAQLMAQTRLSPSHNYDIVENSRPSTPSLPEDVAASETKVKQKKKKRDRKSSNKINNSSYHGTALNTVATANGDVGQNQHPAPPSAMYAAGGHAMPELISSAAAAAAASPFSLITQQHQASSLVQQAAETGATMPAQQPHANAHHQHHHHQQQQHHHFTPRPIAPHLPGRMSEGSSCSDADGTLKRSKRMRRPNKFYGYTSDDEAAGLSLGQPLMIGMRAIKPQPPPQLTWRKEDLPTPAKSLLNSGKIKQPRTPKTPATLNGPAGPIEGGPFGGVGGGGVGGTPFNNSTPVAIGTQKVSRKRRSALAALRGDKPAPRKRAKKNAAPQLPPIPPLKIRSMQIAASNPQYHHEQHLLPNNIYGNGTYTAMADGNGGGAGGANNNNDDDDDEDDDDDDDEEDDDDTSDSSSDDEATAAIKEKLQQQQQQQQLWNASLQMHAAKTGPPPPPGGQATAQQQAVAALLPQRLPPTPPTTAFNHKIPPALLPNPDFATLQYFKANNIRYPIRPPAGARQPRDGESVYCYCRCPYDEVSEMIACDGENCLIEWFHFECVGIMVAPQGKWFCAECRPQYSEELYPTTVGTNANVMQQQHG